jgi:hypothetical protein
VAHDEQDEPLFPELMAELDAIKSRTLSGLMIRRDRKDRKAAYPLPWITAKGGFNYLRATVKEVVRVAKLRDCSATISLLPRTRNCALPGAIGQRGSSGPTPNAHVSSSSSSSMSPKNGVQSGGTSSLH